MEGDRRMRSPSRTAASVATALLVAAVAGGVLSRSLLHSGAASSRATQTRVLVLFNEQRAAHGLKPLTIDEKLTRAADSHSADMLDRGYFAHDGPQGKWDVRVRRYVQRTLIGEILSEGSGYYATPAGMVHAWMHSPEHRRVILTPDLRLVGFGVATGTYQGQVDVALATADFSSNVNAGGTKT
jgi:uncharacterized protein YkwD